MPEYLMLIAEWWLGLDVIQQILWSIAMVSSILLFILMVFSLYGQDPESEAARDRTRSRLVEPKTVLMALTCMGWLGLLVYSLSENLGLTLLSCAFGAALGAFLPWWLGPYIRRGPFDAEAARASIGEVLRSVPPHRNGFGKVHLNLRAAPFEMDAVTAGEELPPGATIRVIEIIDERVLLVEAVEKRKDGDQRPSPAKTPPGPGGPGI